MLVRRIRKRGATITSEANGEVLFAPGTDLSRWKNRFSNRITAFTREAAPVHNYAERPLRPHPGPHLRDTITSSTSTQPNRGGGRFYIAVGSRSPYATFVDQGTQAHTVKLLPPYAMGSPTLYEAGWNPGNNKISANGEGIPPLMVRGQAARNFFDEGLKRGFRSMRIRSIKVPGEGVSGMASSMASFPSSLVNLAVASKGQAYDPSLSAWRAWRDAAFYANRAFQRGTSPTKRESELLRARVSRRNRRKFTAEEIRRQRREDRKAETRAKHAQKMREWRKKNKSVTAPDKPHRSNTAAANSRVNLINRAKTAAVKDANSFLKAHPGFSRAGSLTPAGFYYTDQRGNRHFHGWPGRILDLFHAAGLSTGE